VSIGEKELTMAPEDTL